MKHYQVWVRGCDLNDVEADTENEAKEYIRKFYGFKRLPRGTVVIEIPSSVVRLTLLYFWPLWPESVLQVLSIQTPEDAGCDCGYNL